jgi:hypothetical protein
MYNLYKIYQITNSSSKAEANRINSQFPILSLIINNTNLLGTGLNDTQKELMIYRQYEEEQFVAVLEQSESLINQFSGDEIVSNLN